MAKWPSTVSLAVTIEAAFFVGSARAESVALDWSGEVKFGYVDFERNAPFGAPYEQKGPYARGRIGLLATYSMGPADIGARLSYRLTSLPKQTDPLGGFTIANASTEEQLDAAMFYASPMLTVSYGNVASAYEYSLESIGTGNTVGGSAELTWLELGSNEGFTNADALLSGASDDVFFRADARTGDLTISASYAPDPGRLGGNVKSIGFAWEKPFDDLTLRVASAHETWSGVYHDMPFYGASVSLRNQKFRGVVNYSSGTAIGSPGLPCRARFIGASIEYRDNGWSVGSGVSRQSEKDPDCGGVFDGRGFGIWVEREVRDVATIVVGYSENHYNSATIDNRRFSIGISREF